MEVSYVIGIMAMLGMNLLRPVAPGLLLSGALFNYHCGNVHAGLTDVYIAGLCSFVCHQAIVLVDFLASRNLCREWRDREWERTVSGRNS